MTTEFHFYSPKEVAQRISQREGEVKLGERICFGTHSIEHSLSEFKGSYVIVGISEDIGPRANLGKGGANEAFEAFLTYWLNTQCNRFIDPKNTLLLGCLNAERESVDPTEIRHAVEQLDDEVAHIISLIFNYNKTPIVIGGGHNNAYPIIKSYYEVFQKKLTILNLDPHADYRALEGRHSGNSFSYAQQNGFIQQYGVIGLHRFYNSEAMLQRMDENNVFYTFYDTYWNNHSNYLHDTAQFIEQNKGDTGIELDLDGIANMPSSAMSPMGWRLEEACAWLQKVKEYKPVYYHFPEGAPKWDANGKLTVGKSIAYLVNEVVRR